MAGVGSQVFRYFREKGLTPQQAAGIVGNTQQESSNNPNAPGGGLIQGQGGRTSSGSLSQQLNGIWGELQGPERGTLQALKGAKNARAAALIFSKRFERPGEPMNNKRVQYAEEALKSFGGINPGPQARPASAASTGTSQGESGSSGVDPQVIAALLSKSQGQESGPAPVQLQQTPAYPGANIGPKVVQGSAAQKEPSNAPTIAALLAQATENGKGPAAPAGAPGPLPEDKGNPIKPGPGGYGALAGAGLSYAGPDQGVDFTGKGVVRAPADIQITRVARNTGWSGEGTLIAGKLLSGPQKGRYVYFAEDLQPAGHVREGGVIRAGSELAKATGSGKAPGIEVGFAQDSRGTAYGTTHDGKPGGPSPVHGQEFARYLQSLLRR